MGEGKGKGNRGAQVEVLKIDGAEEGIVGDSRVEQDGDGSERDSGSGRRTRSGETVTTRGATHSTIHVGPQRAQGAWEEERGRCPFFFDHPIVVGGVGGVSVDGGYSPRRFDELDKLVVVADDPLCAIEARERRPKR